MEKLKNGHKSLMNNAYENQRQKGTILLIVLFVVAFLEVIALSYLSSQKSSIRSLENLIFSTSFKYELDAFESQIKINLIQALKDNPGESVYDLTLGRAVDYQERININNFVKSDDQEVLYNALKKIALIPEYKFNGNVDALIAKIQKYLDVYVKHYAMNPSILPFSHINDLSDMNLTTVEFDFLKKAFVVLPTLVSLNINTITAESLLSLSDELSYEEAQTLISIRDNHKPIKDSSDYFMLDGVKNKNLSEDNIVISSQFYLLDYTIEYKRLKYHLQSLAEIIPEENNSKVVIRWRQFG
jgi:type II secretory pathway component PulK